MEAKYMAGQQRHYDGANKANRKTREAIKQRKLLTYVDTVEIKIEKVEEPHLTAAALRSYNEAKMNTLRYNNFSDFTQITGRLTDQQLRNVKTAYIRHNLTNYMDILNKISGAGVVSKPNRQQIKELIAPRLKTRVNNAINEAYFNQKQIENEATTEVQ
jgi:hypothetical protein